MKPRFRILLFRTGYPCRCYRVKNGDVDYRDWWVFDPYYDWIRTIQIY